MVRVSKGLDGVVIDDSRVSMVDGEAGEIWYRGYLLDELAEHASFTETLFLLWNDRLPTRAELERLDERLAANRTLPNGVAATVADLAPRVSPMDTLRTAVSMLAGYVEDPGDVHASLREHLLGVVAKVPTIVAYTYRHRLGRDVVEPRADLGHAENFLYMLTGEQPSAERAAALDRTLVLYAEHEMNASTFAGVVTASTLANPYAAMTSAIGTLQGPLHGGATETVVGMLEEIGGPENVEDWVGNAIASGERIPGFGHRVYAVDDPRCAHFRAGIEEIGPTGEVAEWFETAERLHDVVTERLGEKGVHANTDLYSGVFYQLLDIPSTFYTTLFATGRVAGWSAHVLEQLADNRIIRPRVEYVGETAREYVPIEERSASVDASE